ncbi:MAG: L-threonylcarbamoyladenylate synthase [Oscillospiraceae bacterium]|jgi:L-threonylcarbamoyladenylate synthase|nr:L-threonylcarbamoyladenylate synthase [Oscillospiraceae bacterium]
MQTERLTNTPAHIARAASLLRAGECVAVPTETVYGLAANALDVAAVAKIFAAKGRPADNPLIVHVLCVEDMMPLVKELPECVKRLASPLAYVTEQNTLRTPQGYKRLPKSVAFFPGPLSVILPKSAAVPDIVSGGLDTVALRIPAHPLARAVLREAGIPLAAPSANRSGSPSPTCAGHVLDDMDGKIAAVLDGGECSIGVESTVLSLAGDVPELLRPGAVTAEQLREVLGEVRISSAVLSDLSDGETAASPGMKYRHYAPKTPVVLLRDSSESYAAWCGANDCMALCFAEDAQYLRVPCFCYGGREDYDAQARLLFDGLRTLDESGFAPLIAAHAPEPIGVGLAVYNRLLRAAGFRILDV